MTTPATEMRVDATLLRIIVGFRLVTAIWVTVLGAISVVSWDARTEIVFGVVALVWIWTGLTFWALRSGKIQSLAWLIADLVVAIVVVVSDSLAEATQGTFVGGYPMTAVLLWGYAYRIPGGLGSGAAIAVTLVLTQTSLAGRIGNSVLYVAVGGVAAWAFQALRDNERRRLQAEADLEDERAARIRSEERADVAAHLHDSVLQTLALIQKGSSDSNEVRNLARVQERELRDWLLGGSDPETAFVGALEAVCADVEKRFGVGVELVAVGDRLLDDHLKALVAAAGESLINAAKHSGVDQVSVYAEASADPVQVFVRDRGVGFDPGAIGDDRRGLVESVRGRMERHGGTVEIVSTPGSGTEVRLTMPAPVDEAAL